MTGIHAIYDMLSWKNTPEIRLKGIRLAEEVRDLSLLIQPPAEPSVWECCAQILYAKSDLELTPYLKYLLEWLQDLNSPGALTILTRLKTFSGKKLKEPFLSCFSQAVGYCNDDGLAWLDYLSELLDNEELKAELPQDVIEKMQIHYHNWGAWRNN